LDQLVIPLEIIKHFVNIYNEQEQKQKCLGISSTGDALGINKKNLNEH